MPLPVLLGQAAAAAADLQFLNQMATDMAATGAQMQARSFQIGLSLFAVLSLAGGTTYFWRYADQHGGSIHGIEAGLFGMVKGLAIPLVVMLAMGNFLPLLVPTALALAGDITGQTVTTGPTDIMVAGILLAGKIIHQPMAQVLNALPPMATGLGAILPGMTIVPNVANLVAHSGMLAVGSIGTILAFLLDIFVVIPAFAIMTLCYLCAIANIAIVLSAGVFQMGWSAAPGTSPMAEKFYSSINAAVMRLIVVYVTVNFITATLGVWSDRAATTDLGQLAIGWLVIAAGSIICAGLAVALPSLAASACGGVPSVSGSDAVGAGRSAANRVGAVANAGAKVVAKAAGRG
jgi:hypothetical protein